MLINNPIRETYDEIRKKYDGYCVLVIECEKEKMDFGSGKAIAYGKELGALTNETINFLDDNEVGIFFFKTFTDFGFSGPIQVTHHV